MQKVLIVSPHFPPVNTADMQRVRMLLPFFRENGWLAQVLAVNPEQVASPIDPWTLSGLPDDVPIHRADALGMNYSRVPGLGRLDWRCYRPLQRLGDQLFKAEKFDLVYFSTTVFGILPIALHWKRKFGVPYVLDYQDPWVNDTYRQNPHIVPPGGRLKYGLLDLVNRVQERRVLKKCEGVTSVSPSYPEQLKARYPGLKQTPALILPFPGSTKDFDRIRESDLQQTMFDPHDGNRHWVYVGRGGADMEKALTGLFEALANWKRTDPAEYSRTRVHFIGTSYAPQGRGTPTVAPLALKLNVQDIVTESTDRIPFSLMLKCLSDADALLAPGSSDPAYTASKLYPYLLAEKPLLAIFHEKSSVCQIIRDVGGAVIMTFNERSGFADIAASVQRDWFDNRQYEARIPLNHAAFEPYSDRGSARQLCSFFNQLTHVEAA